MSSEGGRDPVDLVADREEVLALLSGEPLRKREMVDRLDHSRSTVDRAVRRLEEAALVEWTGGGYVTTAAGRLALDRYRQFVQEERAVMEARPILERFPPDSEFPLSFLSGAEALAEDPEQLFERLAERLRTASECRLLLPVLPDSRLLRLLHARVVRDALDLELLVAPPLLDRLREEFPRLVADVAGSETASIHEVTAPSFGLLVTEERSADADGTTASDEPAGTDRVTAAATAVAFEGGELAALVHTDAGDAVRWANERHASLRAAGEDVTDALRDADADVDATPFGAEAPRGWAALRDLGFARVDESYFTERTPGDPATSWQVGFDLVDVYYGYAFDRVDPRTADDDPDRVVDLLVDGLRSGDPHVVLGPPGSGKSTVCRTVACQWVETGRGVVLYRGSPTRAGMDAIGPLVDAIERADDRALVVVEDATAEGVASRVRELVRRYRDDPAVSVLLEARTHDWESLGTGATRRLDDLERAVTEYRLPRPDEGTCERAIERFEAATGRTVPLSPTELHDRVLTEGGTGEMFRLGYQLLAHTNSEGGSREATPAGLESDIESVYEFLLPGSDADETLPLEVGVLAATLTAAELPVGRGTLHAVAAARDDRSVHRRVDFVVDRLTGTVLFDGGDGAYRTRHPFWAVLFLEQGLDRAERTTVAAFESAVNAVLALADEPARRERIERWLGREFPAVGQLLTDAGPEGGDEAESPVIDALVGRLFDLGTRHADLAPLFGTSERSGIDLPAPCTAETELRCIEARGEMWFERGEFDRAVEEYDRLQQRAEATSVDEEVRVRYVCSALKGLGDTAREQGEFEVARERHERRLAIARDAGHRHAEVRALNDLGWAARQADDFEAAERFLADAEELASELDANQPLSVAYYNQGAVALSRGDFERAEERLNKSLELDRELGNRADEASTLNVLAIVAKDRDADDRAREYYRRALAAKREIGDRPGIQSVLSNFGGFLADRGDLDAAADHLREALTLARDIGMPRREADTLGGIANVDRKRGNYDEAARRHRERREIYREVGYDLGAILATADLGRVARDRGDLDDAVQHLRESFDALREIGATRRTLDVVEWLVDVHVRRDEEEAAVEWCETGRELAAGEGLDHQLETFEDRYDELVASASE